METALSKIFFYTDCCHLIFLVKLKIKRKSSRFVVKKGLSLKEALIKYVRYVFLVKRVLKKFTQ